METPITVGVIGATGKTGRSVAVTSFTQQASVDSQANNTLKAKGFQIVGYNLDGPREVLVPWIEAAKEAGLKRFMPSEWVGPAPRGLIDIKDKKLDSLGVIQGVGLPYTLIDVKRWFQVWVPKIPSGRSDHAHSNYIDHRIVGHGDQKFGLTDMGDIGRWQENGEKVDIMDVANYKMGQYRISWYIRGDNTPEYAEYLGYLDFWKLFPDFPKGRSLKAFYQQVLTEGSK
ncbi:hypothetical protein AtubIFM55763_007281 [Aspergillus tubingensis]|nr:hypothetical protein AtubIFM54640_002603 [Aspergillus tubingensis]GLA75727.1 hypothetical protein AtubIFM55763_007281 [Aspergillus tubingensis]